MSADGKIRWQNEHNHALQGEQRRKQASVLAQGPRLSSQRVRRRMAGNSRPGLASCPELFEPADPQTS